MFEKVAHCLILKDKMYKRVRTTLQNYSTNLSVINKVAKRCQLHQSEPKMVHVARKKARKTCRRENSVESVGKREIGRKGGKMVTTVKGRSIINNYSPK